MKIYDQLDKEGRISAFEVSNTFLSRKGLCKIVRSISEAQIIKAPGFRSSFKGEDEFCEFEIRGQKFKAWEPFGDNSRYWIGSEPPNWCEQLETIRSVFMHYKLFGLF
jgi:hypothetical protein